MSQYLLELICAIAFGLACMALGYRRGLSSGMKKRSRLHILHGQPRLADRKVRSRSRELESTMS